MCEKTQKRGNMVKEGFVWMGTSVAFDAFGEVFGEVSHQMTYHLMVQMVKNLSAMQISRV